MITDDQLKEVLWQICLSDHLGDVCEAIEPILEHFGLALNGLEAIRAEMETKGLQPEWAKEDD